MLLFCGALRAAPVYTATPLGIVQGFSLPVPRDVNNAGQAVSSLLGISGDRIALWDAINGYQILGTLPGGVTANGYGLNNAGQVTGYSHFPPASQHAIVWDPVGGMRSIGTLPGKTVATGLAINDLGQVTGYSGFSRSEEAFVWDSVNGMQGLGFLPGQTYSQGTGINNLGQIAGFSGTNAFVWDQLTGMHDLGVVVALPSGSGIPLQINDSGRVGGTAYVAGSLQAFIWDPVSGLRFIGSLPGYTSSALSDLNNSGMAVGNSSTGLATPLRPYVWDGSAMYDLNNQILSPGWNLFSVSAISDTGLIFGEGFLNGNLQPVLLTPSEVPEGSSGLLTGFALAALCCVRVSRRPDRPSSRAYVSQILSGHRPIGKAAAARLAKFFHVRPHSFL